MPTFDVVMGISIDTVKRFIDQANKEITARFDFRGSDAHIEQKEYELTAYADNGTMLDQLRIILVDNVSRYGIDSRLLDYGKIEKIDGKKSKQIITVKNGMFNELAEKIFKIVKESKLELQASIQGNAVRISSNRLDDLLEIRGILLKDEPFSFNNFRD